MNFTIPTQMIYETKTLSNSECFDLCSKTKTDITYQPFVLIGLSLIFSVLSYYIVSNYEELIRRFPNKEKQLILLQDYLTVASLICQSGLGLWIYYLISKGIT